MPAYAWQNIKRRIADIKSPYGAEIGVHRGVLSERLLKNIPGLTLIMVDPWCPDAYAGKGDDAASPEKMRDYIENHAENYQAALDAVKPYGGRYRILNKMSVHASRYFDDDFDFVFIDGAHDYDSVMEDIKAWLPKVKKGGWLCGHDYGVFDGVKKAVDEMFGKLVEVDSDFTWFVRVG